MIYPLLRAIAGIALRWYYADVTIARERSDSLAGPLLVVVNHPNSLVDVLVAGRAVPRRLLFTAKSTLFANPVSRMLLGWLGVIPLRRTGDDGGSADPARNADAFAAIARALQNGGAILIFPEGKTHDEPAISPLRTGAARMALHARESGVRGLRILPIGLVFERKDTPRSRILAVVGDPLDVDEWSPRDLTKAVVELTAEVDDRLRAVTLNYQTGLEAAADARLSRQIASLVRFESPSLGAAGDLRDRTTIARLLPSVRSATVVGPESLRSRAAVFETELMSLQQSLDSHHIALDDLTISRGVKEGTIFVVREGIILLIAGPVAAWGWLNHILPFRSALAVGRRNRQSAADPAMRTILAGIVFVLAVYMVQGAAVALIFGGWWGIAYVVSLPIAADVNLRLRDRLDRAARRARTYLLFRADPHLHDQLELRARALRAEALALADATAPVPETR